MIAFYAIALAVSALILTIALRMERSAILQKINGANGLALLAAFITSATATIPVAAVAWLADGPLPAGAVLLVSALWHLAAWRLALAYLKSLIATATGATPTATTKAAP